MHGLDNVMFLTLTFNSRAVQVPGIDDSVAMRARAFDGIRAAVRRDFKHGLYTPDGAGVALWGIDVLEWQKRGDPHCHVLMKFPGLAWTAAQIDSVLSACLPTDEEEAGTPGLRALVQGLHIHQHSARCGGLEGPCCWGFPLPPVPRTYCDEQGRWHLRRSQRDAWVTPHVPQLLIRTRCHSFCVIATGTCALGYTVSYNCKGDAHARMAIAEAHAEADEGQPVDEVKVCICHTHRP